jgi:1,4-dihydroxy-6-naphthoate synthase
MKLTLGFSPCPNDTFIFDALVNKKIDGQGFEFEAVLEDVQTLNEWAHEGRLDISKMSFPALFKNDDKYQLLSSGSALGKGVGPLLVAKSMVSLPDVSHLRIAIPGVDTTANFLLDHAFPLSKYRIPMLFSEIEDAVLNGEVDLGVIIHENRFTYQQKGLVKVADLGALWETSTGSYIPLGCIAINKKQVAHAAKVDRLIRESLVYAFNHYPSLPEYVKQHSQAMEESVMRQHIELYVNDFSLDLGEEGRKAVGLLEEIFRKRYS